MSGPLWGLTIAIKQLEIQVRYAATCRTDKEI